MSTEIFSKSKDLLKLVNNNDMKNHIRNIAVRYASKSDIYALTKTYPLLVLLYHSDYDHSIMLEALGKCDYNDKPVVCATDKITPNYKDRLLQALADASIYFHAPIIYKNVEWLFADAKYNCNISCKILGQFTGVPDMCKFIDKFRQYDPCASCSYCDGLPLKYIKHNAEYDNIVSARVQNYINGASDNAGIGLSDYMLSKLAEWPREMGNPLDDLISCVAANCDPFKPMSWISRLVVMPGYHEIAPAPLGYIAIKFTKQHQREPIPTLRVYTVYVSASVQNDNLQAIGVLFNNYLRDTGDADCEKLQAEYSIKNRHTLISLLYK